MSSIAHEAPLHAVYDSGRPVDLLTSLSILSRGVGDPTIRLSRTQAWLAFATPAGDATLKISKASLTSSASLNAWGPGAQWALDSAPDLLGASDDWSDFEDPAFFSTLPELVQRTRGIHPGLILPSTHRIFEHATGAVLEQRVTGMEANHAWRWVIRHRGRPAPGPVPEGLRIFPSPADIAALQRWDWQSARVENKRALTLRHLAQSSTRLDWWATMPLGHAKPEARGVGSLEAAMLSLPGIGPWTVAETLQRSHGSPDHLSVGDFHLAGFVGQVLTGRRATDAEMLELLEPWNGQRQRIVRLLMLSGEKKQSFGPRYAPLDHRGR